MNKKKIIFSLFKMIFVGFIAKILSVFVKIFLARKISLESMSLYTLTMPTIVLLINLAQAGFPTAVAKLIAQNRNKATKILGVSFVLSAILNIILGIIYFATVPLLAQHLLHNPATSFTLYVGGFIMPLVSFSGILKGYFIGIEKVEKSSYCQISEEIARIVFIIIFIDIFANSSPSILSAIAMSSVLVGEIASIIHLYLATHVNKKEKLSFYKNVESEEKKQIQKEILKVAIPTTSTRIIGSISYFLEPILFTTLMLKSNIPLEKITQEYGIINGYVMPLLLLPGFFASAFSLVLLPLMSKEIAKKNYLRSKKLLKYFTFASFFIGLCFSLILLMAPEFFLNLLYKHTYGIDYVRHYAIFMLIYYIQAPLNSAMIALSLEKNIMIDSLINNIIKILSYIILIPLYQTDGLMIGVLISVYLSVVINIFLIIRKYRLLMQEKN